MSCSGADADGDNVADHADVAVDDYADIEEMEDEEFDDDINDMSGNEQSDARNAILSVDVNISLPEDDADDHSILNNVSAQVNEALEQALDEILSQGHSEHSGHDDLDPADETNMFDLEDNHVEDDDDDGAANRGEPNFLSWYRSL